MKRIKAYPIVKIRNEIGKQLRKNKHCKEPFNKYRDYQLRKDEIFTTLVTSSNGKDNIICEIWSKK